MESKTSTISKILLIIFSVLAILVDIFYVYIILNNDISVDNFFQSDNVIATTVDDEGAIREANYFEYNMMSNKNGNGKFLGELLINQWSSPSKENIETLGYQYTKEIAANSNTKIEPYYYENTYNTNLLWIPIDWNSADDWRGILIGNDNIRDNADKLKKNVNRFIVGSLDSELNFTGGTDTDLKIDNSSRGLIIEINNVVYKLSFKNYQHVETWYNFFGKEYKKYISYHIDSLHAFLSNYVLSKGLNISRKENVDIGQFFDFNKWQQNGEDTGKWIKYEPDNNRFFVPVYFHYTDDGVKVAKESLFDMVDGSGKFNLTGEDIGEYWSVNVVYNLDNNDFKLRYSELLSGYVLSLKDTVLTNINENKNAILKANISVGNIDSKNIVGFDYYCFSGIRVKEITLNGSGTFTLLDYSFKNSQLQTIRRKSAVNLVVSENAINNEYKLEVI